MLPSVAKDASAIINQLRMLYEVTKGEKDNAYLERNYLVALLATLFPSGTRNSEIEGWSADWHGCVYIDLPTGQASWHYHDSQSHLFANLPAYTKLYDGHTTREKYVVRIGSLIDKKG